jgi:hypothetical protein
VGVEGDPEGVVVWRGFAEVQGEFLAGRQVGDEHVFGDEDVAHVAVSDVGRRGHHFDHGESLLQAVDNKCFGRIVEVHADGAFHSGGGICVDEIQEALYALCEFGAAERGCARHRELVVADHVVVRRVKGEAALVKEGVPKGAGHLQGHRKDRNIQDPQHRRLTVAFRSPFGGLSVAFRWPFGGLSVASPPRA